MIRTQLKLLLVDFDGVLSNGRFYSSAETADHTIGREAVKSIFASDDGQLLEDWMRGKLTYHQLHDKVAQRTGVDARHLDTLLEKSARQMPLNYSLLHHVANLRQNGIIVSLFTNNMDIFDTVVRNHHGLDDMFDFIYSSSAYGTLKLENEILLKQALKDADATVETTVLVDDSITSIEAGSRQGLHVFHYPDYEHSQPLFKTWLAENFAVS